MVSEVRAVALDDEQFFFIEDLGLWHMRAGNQATAAKLLAIALAWKVAPKIRDGTTGTRTSVAPSPEEAPSPQRVTTSPKSSVPDVFPCHVDESGGMADVVELHGYSKKVPPPCS